MIAEAGPRELAVDPASKTGPYLFPDAGTLRFDGQEITSLNQNQLRDFRRTKTGMVFQHFGLLPHRTVLENVAFPLREHTALTESMIRKLVLEGDDHKLPDAIRIGEEDGMQDFTMSLKHLIDTELIDRPTAFAVAPNKDALKMALKGIEVSQPGII